MSAPSDDQGFPAEDQDGPPTVADQIRNRVIYDEVVKPLATFFGAGTALPQQLGPQDSSGHYSLSRDEVRAQMAKWEGVMDRTSDVYRRLRRAQEAVYPPAEDDPSRTQTRGSVDTVTAAASHVQAMLEYAANYHNNLAKSIGDYDEVEQVNVGNANRADHGGAAAGRAV